MRNRICKVTQHHVNLKRGENVSKMHLINVGGGLQSISGGSSKGLATKTIRSPIKSDDLGFRMLV